MTSSDFQWPEHASSSFTRNASEDSDREPACEHERSAVAEERQRNARDRHQVERHAHVLEHVREPAREKSKRHQARERIIRAFGDANDAQEQEQKERQREPDTDEAKLLS